MRPSRIGGGHGHRPRLERHDPRGRPSLAMRIHALPCLQFVRPPVCVRVIVDAHADQVPGSNIDAIALDDVVGLQAFVQRRHHILPNQLEGVLHIRRHPLLRARPVHLESHGARLKRPEAPLDERAVSREHALHVHHLPVAHLFDLTSPYHRTSHRFELGEVDVLLVQVELHLGHIENIHARLGIRPHVPAPHQQLRRRDVLRMHHHIP
mmetsp:Transcript_64569/g.154038  ORF Transcript_64569/g.154038 Transcript_64569/m.154038 type:complete len:209 (-) Transcript_64569:1024-1650(-)